MFCMKIVFNVPIKSAYQSLSHCFEFIFWGKTHCLTLDDGPKSSEKWVKFGIIGKVNLSSLFQVIIAETDHK